ncbi:aspartate ammonia-lyase [Microbulbifer yueqingensis]|uniref:Aspartate ammonia-lyase n=1 Tax=Microbulbifer yueqingensis TaxID=658219 RepID=A0A1G8UJN2_9GAMM|nr:aspartate ammonia-lyase [Microbulbifer yueqingensis]SDJ53991.1 aspartate ammonia-lyase [Microbulbifer yueqingensis]
MSDTVDFRVEKDLLGERPVPAAAYYGVQTLRALENFSISGIPLKHFPDLVVALAMVKRACAGANRDLGKLEEEQHRAIAQACDELVGGRHHEHFCVDMIQGGAGTSTNMNANEVIANRGLEILGHNRGDYDVLHPNIHVNMSQSTNDVYPTALRLAMVFGLRELTVAAGELQEALAEKGREFSSVLKMGRTQLQDAVPMSLGQEFSAFATNIGEEVARLNEMAELLTEVNLGGTAIGTGLNTEADYRELAIGHLRRISGVPVKAAADLVEATSDMGAFVLLSGMLKRCAIKLSKICNDLRLLSSGPRAGLNEINLPQKQPGSSIMPGKVNPVIPEAVNQVAFTVIGNDTAITMAAEAGQLQLNVMEPLIGFKLLESIRYLGAAMGSLQRDCIQGITANEEVCRGYLEQSIGLVTALNPYLGYGKTSAIAQKALATGRSVLELVIEENLMSREQLEALLSPEAMLAPATRSLDLPV